MFEAKLLMDNDVADVADFPTRNARVPVDGRWQAPAKLLMDNDVTV